MNSTVSMDRAQFGRRQAEMTANWMANVVARHGDHDAYIGLRRIAYLDRWREAARFIPDDARVLDIGGGNLWPGLLDFFQARRFDYWYLDVDPSCVDGNRALATEQGFDPAHFAVGFNDRLEYPDDAFDAVFSSHCVEHSFQLRTTLDELWRVITPGGVALIAVPLGWEENPEHPYCFGAEEWVALVEDAGFEIRVAQVGREYPEVGYDLFIAARKASKPPLSRRIDPDDYRKSTYTFLRHDDPRIAYGVAPAVASAHALSDGVDWSIAIEPGAGVTRVLPVVERHPWSGIIEVRGGGAAAQADLYSWFSFPQPVRLTLPEPTVAGDRVEIRPLGRNPLSRGTQCALYGVMIA